MNYIVGIALAVSIGGALYFALRSPAVWAALEQSLIKLALPSIAKVIKRKLPELEAKDHDTLAKGDDLSNRPFGRQKGE